MTIKAEIQELSPSALIEMFELTLLHPEDEKQEPFRFHCGTNQFGAAIKWQGKEYVALPIETEGFDVTSQGTLPRPKLRVANVNGLFSALIRDCDDLVGATVVRKRTLARYLDAENFKEGNPYADPTQSFPDDVWYVEQKTNETRYLIEWELSSAFDLQGVKLPKRQVIQNSCQWKYRGGDCGYQGGFFDKYNKMCSQKDDCCPKTLAACEVRFETQPGWDRVLPFGGFPGATRT